jgi:hypothetical protein
VYHDLAEARIAAPGAPASDSRSAGNVARRSRSFQPRSSSRCTCALRKSPAPVMISWAMMSLPF